MYNEIARCLRTRAIKVEEYESITITINNNVCTLYDAIYYRDCNGNVLLFEVIESTKEVDIWRLEGTVYSLQRLLIGDVYELIFEIGIYVGSL